jgi:hypothetical protein
VWDEVEAMVVEPVPRAAVGDSLTAPSAPGVRSRHLELVQSAVDRIKALHSTDVHCIPRLQGKEGRKAVFLLSDSTCRTNSSKGSKQVDYTANRNGFCDLFDMMHPNHFLVAAVWSGALLKDLLRMAEMLPPGLGGATLVWMGNDLPRLA